LFSASADKNVTKLPPFSCHPKHSYPSFSGGSGNSIEVASLIV